MQDVKVSEGDGINTIRKLMLLLFIILPFVLYNISLYLVWTITCTEKDKTMKCEHFSLQMASSSSSSAPALYTIIPGGDVSNVPECRFEKTTLFLFFSKKSLDSSTYQFFFNLSQIFFGTFSSRNGPGGAPVRCEKVRQFPN